MRHAHRMEVCRCYPAIQEGRPVRSQQLQADFYYSRCGQVVRKSGVIAVDDVSVLPRFDLSTAVWFPVWHVHGAAMLDVVTYVTDKWQHWKGSGDVTRDGWDFESLRQRRACLPPGQAGLSRDTARLVRGLVAGTESVDWVVATCQRDAWHRAGFRLGPGLIFAVH